MCCFIFGVFRFCGSVCEENKLCCAVHDVHDLFMMYNFVFLSVKSIMYYSSAHFMLPWSFIEKNKLAVRGSSVSKNIYI